MTFESYNFAKHQGVTASCAKAIKKRFQSWQDITDALPEEVLEVNGVDADIAEDLIETARAQIRLEERTRLRTGEQLVAPPQEAQGNLYVLTEKSADHISRDAGGKVTNMKRRRKLLTPALCPKCGHDFGEQMGVGAWETLTPATQDALRETVSKHLASQHDKSTERIIDEATLNSLGA